MADITKCSNAVDIDCPLRHRCYRHLAVSSPGSQSFAVFDYYANSCSGYWEILTPQEERESVRESEKEQFKLG